MIVISFRIILLIAGGLVLFGLYRTLTRSSAFGTLVEDEDADVIGGWEEAKAKVERRQSTLRRYQEEHQRSLDEIARNLEM